MAGYAYQLRLKDANAGVIDMFVPSPAALPRIGDTILFEDGQPQHLRAFPGTLWVEAVDHPVRGDDDPKVLNAGLPLVVATSRIVRVGAVA